MDFIKAEIKADILDHEALRDYAKSKMSEKRFVHTLGVESTCERLGELFLSSDDAALLRSAALLHDITKELTYDEQLILAKNFGILLKDADLYIPKSLHSRTGAAVAREYFNAPDKVCTAISAHTTGREDMDTFDKLLYLADCIEPNRTDGECMSLRKNFYKKLKKADTPQSRDGVLDEVMLESLDGTMKFLLKKGKGIHPDSVAARNRIINSHFTQDK